MKFKNISNLIFLISFCKPIIVYADSNLSTSSRSQDVINEFFGKKNQFTAPIPIQFDLGGIGAGAATRLSCGNVNLVSQFDAYMNDINKQLGVVLNTVKDIPAHPDKYAVAGAMVTICYMNPVVCDQIRNFKVDLGALLNLRFDTCKAIDSYIDKRSDQGSQMIAEAKAECVNSKTKSGVDMAVAVADCDSQGNFNIRDFNGNLNKQFTNEKQKTLLSMVNFSKSTNYYDFIKPILGEVEVQNDGYYRPLFDSGMLKPYDAAKQILAQAQDNICDSNNFRNILTASNINSKDKVDEKLKIFMRSKLTIQDYKNLQVLRSDEREFACNALSRVVAKEAGHDITSEARSVIVSGLNNPNIPQDLKNEYSKKSDKSFNEVDSSLNNFEYRTLEQVQKNISLLANATIRDNQKTGSSMSIEKSIDDIKQGKECVDVLSCTRKRR